MSDSVIDERAAAEILRAGNICVSGNELRDLAAELDRIAHSFFTERYFLRGSRGRPITKIGAKIRKELFGNLVGFWIKTPGINRIPGAIWDNYQETYRGRFISFAQAYCGALADHIEAEQKKGRGAGWHSVASDLRRIQFSTGKAREGLRLIKLGVLRRLAGDIKRDPTKKPHYR